MKINHVCAKPRVSSVSFAKKNAIKSVSNDGLEKLKQNCFACISFTGKKRYQVAIIGAEGQRLFPTFKPNDAKHLHPFDKTHYCAGAGDVVGDLSKLLPQEGIKTVTFLPYYSYDNAFDCKKNEQVIKTQDGEYKKVSAECSLQKGEAKCKKIENSICVRTQDNTFKNVDLSLYKLKEGESYCFRGPDNTYRDIIDIGIQGSIKHTDAQLQKQIVPYRAFALAGTENLKQLSAVLVYTPGLATYPKAYTPAELLHSAGAYYDGEDALYAQFSRATAKIMQQLNQDRYGNRDFGAVILNDRQTAPFLPYILQEAATGNRYWQGMRYDYIAHNCLEQYQGYTTNPFPLIPCVCNSDDVERFLKQDPTRAEFLKQAQKDIKEGEKQAYDKAVQEIKEKFKEQGEDAIKAQIAKIKLYVDPEKTLGKDRYKKLQDYLEPLLGPYIDSQGRYNLTMTPARASQLNPNNVCWHTVSRNFGAEVQDPNNRIGRGLETIATETRFAQNSITNGVDVMGSLQRDKTGNFGVGNGFTQEVKQNFTPLADNVIDDTKNLLSVKQDNAKWLIDLMTNKTEEDLAKLFFTEGQIQGGAKVYGTMSAFQEGDFLDCSFARPDPQKGYPIVFQAYRDFFADPNIDETIKQHTKVVVGGGVWDLAQEGDGKLIQEALYGADGKSGILTMESNKWAKNFVFANGFFPDRLLLACHSFIGTSRAEPCGLVYPKAMASGAPPIHIKTGGAPDFITAYNPETKNFNEANGFLTEHSFYEMFEIVKKENPTWSDKQIDEETVKRMAGEIRELIALRNDLYLHDKEDYSQLMQNAAKLEIDWKNNGVVNGSGQSSLELYKERLGAYEGAKVYDGPLKPITQPIFDTGSTALSSSTAKSSVKETQKETAKGLSGVIEFLTKGKNKYITLSVALLSFSGIVLAFSKNKKQNKQQAIKPKETKAQNQVSNTQTLLQRKQNIPSFARFAKA